MAPRRRNLCDDILRLIDDALADHERAVAVVADRMPLAPVPATAAPSAQRPGSIR